MTSKKQGVVRLHVHFAEESMIDYCFDVVLGIPLNFAREFKISQYSSLDRKSVV